MPYMNACSKKVLLLLSFVLLVATNGFAKSRTGREALGIANSFCQKIQNPMARSLSGDTDVKKLAYACTDSVVSPSLLSNDNVYYYVINIGEDKGFVIVSGDDRAKDILGYSDEGSFSTENMPENLKNWMALYKKELKALVAIPEDTTITTTESVPITRNSRTTNTTNFATNINPLLGTIAWNQSAPYNILCPVINTTQAPTGCVATAMAQVMKYHQWPVTGTGTKTYVPYNLKDSLTVDFSKTTYDWTNMLNAYNGNSTTVQDTAVATLIYHCGVALSMVYEEGASAAYSNDIPAALSNYFGYDPNVQLYSRDYYTESEWQNLMKTELNASRPILYGGSNLDGAGHQFVCDGYDSNNLFHFNWGWGGMCNGYFELTSLNALTPGIGGGTGGYAIGQDMVIGIQKPTDMSLKNYQLFLLQAPAVNKTRIPRESIFNITFGVANLGGNTFDGAFALGLYQGDSLVSILKEYTNESIPSYYGESGIIADTLSIPLSVTGGTYQIFSIYKSKDQSSWSIMKYKVGTPYSLDVTVSPAAIAFETPDAYPQLTLKEPLKVIGNLYKGETARISATIQNTGSEYNSYLVVNLKNNTTDVYVGIDIYNIPSGTTKTIEMTGYISLKPGDYTMTVMYDFNNDQSNISIERLSPFTNSSISVTVKNDTVIQAPALTLTEKISLADSTITNGSEALLTAKVKNTGGYFNNYLIAYILTPTEDTSIDYIGPINVILDTNEEKEITYRKNMSLDEGTYHLALYYFNDSISGGWGKLTPDSYNRISFTVTNPTGIEEVTAGKPGIYSNPATDVLYIHYPSMIKSVLILNISGKQIFRQEPQIAGTVPVTVKNLSKGIYFIKIETEAGIYIEKFLKK